MIKGLREACIADGVPRILSREPWVQALSLACLALHRQTMAFLEKSRIYTAVDSAAEEVLDALAVNWNISWYDTDYDIERKRRIVRSALGVRRTMGTVGAVRAQADAAYPGTTLVEWFEYDGEPGKFRLRMSAQTAADREKLEAMSTEEIERRFAVAKRFSAHLEDVEIFDTGGTATSYALAAVCGGTFRDGGTAEKY